MNRHTRAAWWRLADRLQPLAAPLFAAGLGTVLAALILWRY